MRGTSLEDWLAADGPVIAITTSGLPGDMHALPLAAAPADGRAPGGAPSDGLAAAAVAGSSGMPAAGPGPAALVADTAVAPGGQAPMPSLQEQQQEQRSGTPLGLQAQLAQMAAAMQASALPQGPRLDFGAAAAAVPASPAAAPAAPFAGLSFPPMPEPLPQPAAASWQAGLPDMSILASAGDGGMSPSASSGAMGMLPQQLGLPAMPPPAPQFSLPLPGSSLGGGSLGAEGDDEIEEVGSGGFVQGAGEKPTTLKKFRDRWVTAGCVCVASRRGVQGVQGTMTPVTAGQLGCSLCCRSVQAGRGSGELACRCVRHVTVLPGPPTTTTSLLRRQQARIAMIEQELAKLQRDMHRMKVENVQLKSKVGNTKGWVALFWVGL